MLSYETFPEVDVFLWEGQNDRTMKIMKDMKKVKDRYQISEVRCPMKKGNDICFSDIGYPTSESSFCHALHVLRGKIGFSYVKLHSVSYQIPPNPPFPKGDFEAFAFGKTEQMPEVLPPLKKGGMGGIFLAYSNLKVHQKPEFHP